MKKTSQKQENLGAVSHAAVTMQDIAFPEHFEEASTRAFSVAVRVFNQNTRQGTVACQGRADVSRSGKKPWKQKGTGRARAGDAKSPLWRGGGVIHGPQARTRVLKVNQKTRKAVFATLLRQFVEMKNVLTIDWTPSDAMKTREAVAMINNVGLSGSKLLFFTTHSDVVTNTVLSNLNNVNVVYFDHPNVVDLAHASKWVFLKKDMELFKGMVSQWL